MVWVKQPATAPTGSTATLNQATSWGVQGASYLTAHVSDGERALPFAIPPANPFPTPRPTPTPGISEVRTKGQIKRLKSDYLDHFLDAFLRVPPFLPRLRPGAPSLRPTPPRPRSRTLASVRSLVCCARQAANRTRRRGPVGRFG